MRNNYFFLILAGAVLGGAFFASPLPVSAKIVDEISLVVDQDAMTKGEMDEAIQTYFLEQRLKPAEPGTPGYENAKKLVVDGFVKEVLLAEEADREKVEIQDGEIDHSVNQQLDNMKKGFTSEQEFNDSLKKEGITLDDLKQDIHDRLLRQIKANHVLRQKQQELPASAVVTDAEVRAYYDQHPGDFEQVKFAMILLRVSPLAKPEEVKQVQVQAREILKDLKAGADFAEKAKKFSEEPGSAANGGEVGTMARGEIGDPKLAQGVFALSVKGLGIIKAGEGIYIVKVEYRGKADYESSASEIQDRLKKQKQETALSTWIEGLKKNAYIVEDGQVISTASTQTTSVNSTGSSLTTAMASDTTANAPTTDATDDDSLFKKSNAYPSLPEGGSLTAHFGGQGFFFGTKDLADYYPSGVNTNEVFPFGAGIAGGLDLAVDPTLQIGIMVEAIRKFPQVLTDLHSYTEEWNCSTIGASLDAKVLIPLDESTNFILSGSGGGFLLLGSSVTISQYTTTSENIDLSGASFGGKAGAALEFMLDSHKNTAVDLGVDYRLLKFSPVTTQVTTNGPIPVSSPLRNADGSEALVDFSGPEITISLRFLLGKDDQ